MASLILNKVDGYNVGARMEFAGNRTLTAYIPRSKLREICPKNQLVGSSNETLGCMADCKKTGRASDCCTGTYDNAAICPPSSNFFLPWTNQSFHYAHDNSKIVHTIRTGKVVKINFGPQNITDVPKISSEEWYKREILRRVIEIKEEEEKKRRGEKDEDRIEAERHT